MVRFSAVSGVIWFVVSTIGIVFFAVSGLSEEAMEAVDAAEIMGAMAANPSSVLTALVLILLSLTFATLFCAGTAEVIGTARSNTSAAEGLLLVGIVIFMIETMTSVALTQMTAAAYDQANLDQRATMDVFVRTLMQFRNAGALMGSTLLATASILLGLVVLQRKSEMPRWLGFLALGGGLVGLIGSLTPIFPMLSSARQAGLIALPFWAAIVGIVRLKRER